MSDAETYLGGETFEGLVSVREIGPCGMISVRGDLGSAAMKKAVKAVARSGVPNQRQIVFAGDSAVAWMSPDELLVMLPGGEAAAAVPAMERALGKAHALVVEVSDARVVFEISGALAREVLAKLLPVDFHPDSFGKGEIRRSHAAQVLAAVWMTGSETFRLVCFRSVAAYVFGLLRAAAAEGGETGLFT